MASSESESGTVTPDLNDLAERDVITVSDALSNDHDDDGHHDDQPTGIAPSQTDTSSNHIGGERNANINQLNPAVHLEILYETDNFTQSRFTGLSEIYTLSDDDENGNYEDDEDECDDDDEDPISIMSSNSVAGGGGDFPAKNGQEVQKTFSELFLVNESQQTSATKPCSPIKEPNAETSTSSLTNATSSCSTEAVPLGTLSAESSKDVTRAILTLPENTPYDRMTFVTALQTVGRGVPLNIIIKENFTISSENTEILMENLNWLYGDIDDFFRMPKVQLERLEYTFMIKLTAGDYAMYNTSSMKCRDREHLLEYRPLEVLFSHYVYFMSLVLLGKMQNAYQAFQDMKVSIAFLKNLNNFRSWIVVYDFIEQTLAHFFNFMIGRAALSCNDVIPSVDDWNRNERLYLSLASFMAFGLTSPVTKSQLIDVEALFDAMIAEGTLSLEWGLYMLDELLCKKKGKIKEERRVCLRNRILNELTNEYTEFRNPFILLASTEKLIREYKTKGKLEIHDCILLYRNLLNVYGNTVRIRLEVVKQLQQLPSTHERNSMIKHCIEKAVDINSLHPVANHFLADVYASMKSSGAVLCLRYLKASIAVDSSNFNAVSEYCKILLGKQFRIMSAAFGAPPTLDKSNNANSRPSGVDVPSIILGFTKGTGIKFWNSYQIGQLKLLLFYGLIMNGAEEDALEVLLTIYGDNKIINELKKMEIVRENYGWSSSSLSFRNLILIFSETYQCILEEEGELESMPVALKPSIESNCKEMKTMLKSVLSFLRDG